MLEENSNYHGQRIVVGNPNKAPKSSFGTVDLTSMSVDEVWKLYEMVEAVVTKKMAAEIVVLGRYLQRLSPESDIAQRRYQKSSKAADAGRRPYPPVLPKYRNPMRPSETWAGRGKKPGWLTLQLESGKQIEDFRIDLATAQANLRRQMQNNEPIAVGH
jgi:DNA-binding protein H-NS